MLVLERKPGQSIQIDSNITIRFLRFNDRGIKLGIAAPKHINIVRTELITPSSRVSIQGGNYDDNPKQ